MDTGVLIATSAGLVTTFFSGFCSWLFTKKRYNAEVDSSVIKNLKESIEVYETMVDDLQKRLEFYVNLAEENKVEMYRIKETMYKMINKSCIDGTCPNRQLYTQDEIKEILGILDGKSPIDYGHNIEKN